MACDVPLRADAERAAAALLHALDAIAAALGHAAARAEPLLPAALLNTLETLAAELAQRRAAAAELRGGLVAGGPEGSGGPAAGRFEWVDGALTRAVEQGRWVLLDNAGACPATVRSHAHTDSTCIRLPQSDNSRRHKLCDACSECQRRHLRAVCSAAFK